MMKQALTEGITIFAIILSALFVRIIENLLLSSRSGLNSLFVFAMLLLGVAFYLGRSWKAKIVESSSQPLVLSKTTRLYITFLLFIIVSALGVLLCMWFKYRLATFTYQPPPLRVFPFIVKSIQACFTTFLFQSLSVVCFLIVAFSVSAIWHDVNYRWLTRKVGVNAPLIHGLFLLMLLAIVPLGMSGVCLLIYPLVILLWLWQLFAVKEGVRLWLIVCAQVWFGLLISGSFAVSLGSVAVVAHDFGLGAIH